MSDNPVPYVVPEDQPWTEGEQAILTEIEGQGGLLTEVIDVESGVIVRLADLQINDMIATKGSNREGALSAANQALGQRREAQAREQPPDEVEP